MRGVRRALLLAVLIGAGPVLAGCADFDMDKLDVFGLSQKKKLPGERQSVFPAGVPGVTQGIPPELTKGHENEQVGAAVPLNTSAPAAEPEKKTAAVAPAEPKPKRKPVHKKVTRVKATPQPAADPAPQAARQPAQAAQPAASSQPAGGWPPPSPPPAEASPWPAPVPSGTFSKQ